MGLPLSYVQHLDAQLPHWVPAQILASSPPRADMTSPMHGKSQFTVQPSSTPTDLMTPPALRLKTSTVYRKSLAPYCTIRGRTDTKLTSTYVIRTFLSFVLADIFKSVGVFYFSKKLKKNSDFHPHRQRQRKHDPLDPARHHYAVSPTERLHFMGLYPHGGITSACGYSGEILPCSVCHLRKRCAIFVT